LAARRQLECVPSVQHRATKRTIVFYIAVLTLLATGFRANAAIIAGPITDPENGQDYYLLSPTTWAAAEVEAENLGGTLAVINNSDEQNWIFSTFGSYGAVTNRSLWIGFRRDGQGRSFSWVAESLEDYTNWSPGEPDNCGGNESDGSWWSRKASNNTMGDAIWRGGVQIK
jgi:hypothetical protein